ncbi:hypothetical protein [Streptomyces sp. A13(2022)]|uniref:hypothetical protein n=1 Tax=Streptomyces sp. A13(2022) TaxID=2964768 RepID=UPI0021D85A0A|nr:hypothetical protein [Streptomyces sp. A13(2022)]MCU8593775.1 hypothetical protein [Streptomyces sp. A13(2022)]
MARIVFPAPPVDSEQTRSFRTHASYIRAFRELALGESALPLEDAVAGLHASAAPLLFRSDGPPRSCDREQLLACLRRAWATARLLEHTHALAEDSEIIRLANSWGAVQTYYVLYGAAQALMVAEGGTRPQSHEPTKRRYVDLWTSRTLHIAPWTVAATSPGDRLADRDGILGGPGRALDLDLHPWVAWQGEQAWDIAAKALRSTRQLLVDTRLAGKRREKLAAKKKQWRLDQEARTASSRKPAAEPRTVRLTAAEREAATDAVRPATMADYLYRLRVKANYEDVTVFSDGPSSDREAAEVGADLVALASATLLVHELRIAAIIGSDDLVKAMDGVLLHTSGESTGGLAHRRDLHARLS